MIDARARYTRTGIALHWATAMLVVCGFALGLWMTGLVLGPLKLKAYAWHKWIGTTVFLLTGLRAAWRAVHSPPPPVPLPAWQRRAAAWAHGLLYALLFAVPLSGWLYSSATGISVVYLGLLPLPDLVGKDKGLAAILRPIHVALNYTLAALVTVHAGAALKHHFLDRDAVLARMSPWSPRA